MEWKFFTEDDRVSLQGCMLTDITERGNDIRLSFNEGFAVYAKNRRNDNGHRSHTGRGVVLLRGGTIPCTMLERAEDVSLPLCIEDATYDDEQCRYSINHGQLVFRVSSIVYCWNELILDEEND